MSKKVAIIGRTNVGKSTLFNRLSTDVKALTLDFEGVTRDFIKEIVHWKGISFDLVDSGGVSLRKTQDPIEQKVRQIGLNLIEDSDLILFVCDGVIGVTTEDKEISRLLHKLNKKVILVINKSDVKISEQNQYEFEKLGFEHIVLISAQHGKGIGDLLDFIVDLLGPMTSLKEEEKTKYKVVLLGKPNVGKSSLLNLLVKGERAIVSEVPGTTREPIIENVKFYQQNIQIIDTAGIRRHKSVIEQIEKMMVKSSLQAMKDADIVLLLVDVSNGKISDQELKLAFYAFEQGKALIILFNKVDLLNEQIKKDLEFNLSEYEYFLNKIEHLNISCETEKNVGKILPLIDKVWQRHSQKISDIDIDQLFKNALLNRPLFHKTQPLVIYSAKQIKTAPITILLIVNEPDWFGDSQLGYLENILRSNYDFKSVPILFIRRKGED